MKSISPLAAWILRISLLIVVVSHMFPVLNNFSFASINDIFSAAFALSALLLVVGGFVKKNTLTMLSGVLLMLLAGWHAYAGGEFNILNLPFASYLLMGAVGFHFFVNGNK
ncbi:MAG TPA: hypothetical protein VLH61_12040 [Bacteroidales bacterium]|nr:hypothetical protein [Bacteroidales bacterium]